jgi:hypothetical protein
VVNGSIFKNKDLLTGFSLQIEITVHCYFLYLLNLIKMKQYLVLTLAILLSVSCKKNTINTHDEKLLLESVVDISNGKDTTLKIVYQYDAQNRLISLPKIPPTIFIIITMRET